MRALIVDDQRDFFESVRPVLRQGGFESDYAPDLTTAESNLVLKSFDLVLTDLQMPPGNWGGLEVIKLVRRVDPAVPLFVVSGKGQLAESIEAKRLGADDYLRKEVFQSEFASCVVPRFDKPYAIERFPSLLAYLFKLFEEERQEYARARRLIDVYENAMRFLSLMILSEELPQRTISLNDLISEVGIGRPSLGSYVSFIFDRLRSTWNGTLLGLLRASDFQKKRADCDRLTKCRNDEFGHSVVISKTRAIEILMTFSKVLVQILNAISCVRQFRLMIIDDLRYDGTSFTAEGKLLSGSNLHHGPVAMKFAKAVPTDHVVAVGRTSVIDLYPLINIVPADSGDWQIYKLYDKMADQKLEFDLIPK